MATEQNDPWSQSDGRGAEQTSPESANPWASGGAEPAPDSAGPGGSTTDLDVTDTGGDWLSGGGQTDVETFSPLHPFDQTLIPLDTWVDQGLEWLVENFRPVFQAIRWPIDATLGAVEAGLLAVPAVVTVVLLCLLAWQLSGRRLALGTLVSLVLVGAIGAWSEAMLTLSLVLTSVLFCVGLGLPTGIWLARNDRAANAVRPLLDAMQTTPAFVYLVPIVMLFGIGNVPGVVVTIIFALPPLIRLTNLGIRQVPTDLIEATRSFGATPRQLLLKVQLPLAMPTIMAGINQTLMLALSMVVIASMIAVGGLGQMVLRGIGRLDMGLATVGGIGIVLLAIILDRMTQAVGKDQRSKATRHWYEAGPAGLVLSLSAYGLCDTVSHNQGSYSAIIAVTTTRHKQGKPVLYYTWTPYWVSGVMVPGRDVVWLQVPFSALPGARGDVDTSLPNGKNYGFQANNQRIIANREFAKANPAAAKLFELMKVSANDISAQNLRMRDGEKSYKDIERHADAWIKANQAKFDGWIEAARAAAM